MEKGGAENPRNCFRPEKSHRLPPIDHTRCATAVTPSTVTVPSDFGERCLGKPADSSFSAPVAAVGQQANEISAGRELLSVGFGWLCTQFTENIRKI